MELHLWDRITALVPCEGGVKPGDRGIIIDAGDVPGGSFLVEFAPAGGYVVTCMEPEELALAAPFSESGKRQTAF